MAAGQQGSDGQRESTVWEPEPGFLPPETPPNASLKKIRNAFSLRPARNCRYSGWSLSDCC